MTKYDNLDARIQLEQEITKDLQRALEKRGFMVRHNGTPDSHTPAGRPDIEIWDDNTHINIEVTKSVKSSQDREWQSIKDHFENTKEKNPEMYVINQLGKRFEKLTVINEKDCIKFKQKCWIEKEVWREVNDILRVNGFSWLSNGKDSCWIRMIAEK